MQHFAQRSCSSSSKNYECWRDNIAKKTGGMWYSTTEQGYCADRQLGEGNCTWRVNQVVKRVNKTCSDNAIYNVVEAYDKSSGTNCFSKCSGTGAQRNSSSTCWIAFSYIRSIVFESPFRNLA